MFSHSQYNSSSENSNLYMSSFINYPVIYLSSSVPHYDSSISLFQYCSILPNADGLKTTRGTSRLNTLPYIPSFFFLSILEELLVQYG